MRTKLSHHQSAEATSTFIVDAPGIDTFRLRYFEWHKRRTQQNVRCRTQARPKRGAEIQSTCWFVSPKFIAHGKRGRRTPPWSPTLEGTACRPTRRKRRDTDMRWAERKAEQNQTNAKNQRRRWDTPQTFTKVNLDKRIRTHRHIHSNSSPHRL